MSSDVAGGAIVSLRKITEEFSQNGLHKLVTVASGVSCKNALTFGTIPHISYNPLLTLKLLDITKNIASAVALVRYFLRNTIGLKKVATERDIIINNGHWCLDSDVITMRFCHKSYKKALIENKKLGTFFHRLLDIKSWIILLIESLMLRSSRLKYIVTLSKESSKDLIRSYPTVAEKVIVIPNGVDTHKFIFSNKTRDDVRRELNISRDAVVILFSGHNTFRKNLVGVMGIFMKLQSEQELHLVALSGESEESPIYQQTKNSKNIHFIKWSDKPEIYYSASDIFLFPTFYDTGTKAILEGIVNGLYIITSENSGVGEFIPPSGGMIIKGRFDCDKYVGAINRLLEESTGDIRTRVARVDIPTWEQVANEYYKLIERIICIKDKK